MKPITNSAIAALLIGSALTWNALAENPPNKPAAANGGPHQSTPGSFANAEVPDGIFRHLGATWIIKKGHGEKVEREMKMAGGITIEPNGSLTFKDGHKAKLKENQMATFDGQLKDVTPSLTLPDNPAGGTK